MTDFMAKMRARQTEINTEIARHLSAISLLTAELCDIATTGRVFATIANDSNSAASTQELPRPMEGAADRGEVRPGLAASNIAPVAMGEADAVDLTASADLSQIGDDGSQAEPDAADERAGEVGPETVGASPARSSTGKTVGPSGSAAPSLRSRIAMLHQAHPEYTAEQAMAALDCKRGSLTGYSAILGIKWARSPNHGGRPAKSPVEAGPPAEAPEPAPEPESPPASTPAPANDTPRVVRPRSGSKFYLVNDKDEFLNRYCGGFTRDRREAWIGTQDQLVGCRRNFDLARDLREKPVTKEQPAPINREVA